jgi:hypothetical protein
LEGGGHRKFTNILNRGPVIIWAFFKTSSSPPLGVINVLSLIQKRLSFANHKLQTLNLKLLACKSLMRVSLWSSIQERALETIASFLALSVPCVPGPKMRAKEKPWGRGWLRLWYVECGWISYFKCFNVHEHAHYII